MQLDVALTVLIVLLGLVVAFMAAAIYKLIERVERLEDSHYPHEHHWHYVIKGGLTALRVCCHCGKGLLSVEQKERPRALEHGAYVEFREPGS